MRLVDIDALEKFIDYGHLNNPNEKLYSENDIREMMDMMLTIEERETGRWRRVPMACYGGGTITEYECSECEEHQVIISNFCPNCGAKMEVENETD